MHLKAGDKLQRLLLSHSCKFSIEMRSEGSKVG
jgi:hypothetical protein